jgi:hypothetical protein
MASSYVVRFIEGSERGLAEKLNALSEAGLEIVQYERECGGFVVLLRRAKVPKAKVVEDERS